MSSCLTTNSLDSMSQFIEMFGDKKNGSVLTVGEISSRLFAGGDKPKDISLCKTEDYKYPVWANGIGENGLMGFGRTYQVDKKSLTISARGTIGYCSIREPYYTPVVRLIVIIPNEKIELTYLKYFFENTGFEKTGAVQGQLTIPILKKKKVYVPSIELQKKFVSIVQQADKSEFGGSKSQFIEMFGTINSPCDKMSTLGELCHIHRGGSPRPIKDYITTDANGLNWIKIGDTDDSMYIKKTEEKIKPSGLKKTRQVYAGDLLLSNSMSFGRPYILKINGCIHDGWLVLHIKDESILTQIYLCAYLSQQSTYEEMSKLAAGGVVQNLNSEIVKKLPVILPPMQKQLEYISILEQADKSEKCCEIRLAS